LRHGRRHQELLDHFVDFERTLSHGEVPAVFEERTAVRL
jgi:hypothetical protein